jgi:hypothetical protein
LLPNGKPALPPNLAQAEYVDFYGTSRLVIRVPEAGGKSVLTIYEPATGDSVRFPDASTFRWNWNTSEAGVIWMRDAKATTELWRLMDRRGKDLGHTRTNRPDGWGFVEDRALHPTGDGWIFIDKTGQVIGGDKSWQEAHDFHEGLAAVKRDDKWGFMDSNGKLVVEPVWKDAHDFHHGRAAVNSAETGFWGYLAPDGSLAMAAVWTEAADFTEWNVNGTGETLSVTNSASSYNRGLRRWESSNDSPWLGEKTDRTRGGQARVRQVALVHNGQAWTLVDRDGLMIADPVITPDAPATFWLKENASGQVSLAKREIASLRGQMVDWLDATTAWVRRNRSYEWELYDHTGRQLGKSTCAAPRYDRTSDVFAGGLITAQSTNDRFALLRPDGSPLLEPRYERIAWVAPGVAAAWSGGEGGLVDAQGKWIFKDNSTHRLARFGTTQDHDTRDELRHGLIVIEDVPKWGYARLNRP